MKPVKVGIKRLAAQTPMIVHKHQNYYQTKRPQENGVQLTACRLEIGSFLSHEEGEHCQLTAGQRHDTLVLS